MFYLWIDATGQQNSIHKWTKLSLCSARLHLAQVCATRSQHLLFTILSPQSYPSMEWQEGSPAPAVFHLSKGLLKNIRFFGKQVDLLAHHITNHLSVYSAYEALPLKSICMPTDIIVILSILPCHHKTDTKISQNYKGFEDIHVLKWWGHPATLSWPPSCSVNFCLLSSHTFIIHLVQRSSATLMSSPISCKKSQTHSSHPSCTADFTLSTFSEVVQGASWKFRYQSLAFSVPSCRSCANQSPF